jgi:TonB-dependent receptor
MSAAAQAQSVESTASAVNKLEPTAAPAGASSAQPNSGAAGLEEVTVTGFRQSYATALANKRDALGVTDGISADGIGRFPDLNVGEALQRIPGVQINREADSRDATINLRGLPGTYARMTLNGNAFADAQLDGSSPLGAFESDIFSAFVVNKTPSAADQPGGLSGNVDLQVSHALARKDGTLAFSVGSGYEESTGKLTPNATGSVAEHFLDDRLGVFATAGYSYQDFRRDSISFNQYTPLSKTTTPNYAAQYGTQTIYFPSDDRQFSKESKGHRMSFAVGTEFKPADDWDINLDDLYTDRNYGDAHTILQEVDLRGANTIVTPAGSPFALADGHTYINKYTFTNPQVNSSYRPEPYIISSNTLMGDVGYTTDKVRSLTTLVYSHASNSVNQGQVDWRKLPLALPAGNGISGSASSGGDDIGNYQLSLTPSPVASFTPGPFTVVNANEVANPSGDHLVVAGTEELAKNNVYSAQSDFEVFIKNRFVDSLQFGIRYEDNKFTSGQNRSTIYGIQSQNISGALIAPANIDGFFGANANGYDTNWQTIDYAAAVAALQPVTVGPGQTLTNAGWVNNVKDSGVGALNFAIGNRIYSGYGMLKFDSKVVSVPVRASAGVRYEYTRQTTDSSQYDANSNLQLTHDTHGYGEALPSVLLMADLTDKFVARAAYYETFVRAQPRQVTPVTVVSGSGTVYNVTLGNLNLRPFTANSFDLSFEYYNRPGGLLSLALFTKKVKRLIGAETDLNRLCPANGGGFGLGTLTLIGNVCYSTYTINGAPVQVNVSGNVNSTAPLTVKGIETSIQQNLDFLPAPLNNLGGILNYSYTTLSGSDSQGHPVVLPGVSKNTANAIAYYEGSVLGVRLTYNYRSAYNLEQGTTFLGAADQVKARGQLDSSVSVKLSDRISVVGDVFNITDVLRTEYQNTLLMPRRIDYDGRTYQLAVRVVL